MKELQMLDCTLRDGAQANGGNFGSEAIRDIIQNLEAAGIDIIECGFLKDSSYEKGKTYFPQPAFARAYIPKVKGKSLYAALVDFGRYDVDNLEENDGTTFDLIRISFFEKDVPNVEKFIEKVKGKGYRISIQPMDTFSYELENILKIIEMANRQQAEVLSMVDTYALATKDDISRLCKIYEENLSEEIKIGFHSHNNQLNSFGLAEFFLEQISPNRSVVVDASLYGMGRGGGNLNTELFAEYLNRKKIKKYDMKPILDMIDRYVIKLKSMYEWGYSIAMMYAGIYGVHVFTTAYLGNKPGVTSYDLKCMFEMLDVHKKKRYDYDYLDGIYEEYMKEKEGGPK